LRIGIAEGVAVLGAALRHSESGPERIFEYRNRHLRRIIRHAHANIPLYRDIWNARGSSPESVRTAGDLSALPAVTRKDFRTRTPDESLARGCDPSRLITIRTTGSTGEPLAVRRTPAEDFVFHVFRMRTMSSFGLRPKDRMARVGTHSHEQSPLAWRAAQRIGLFRQTQVPLLDTPSDIAAALGKADPDVVTGNSGVLTRAAREVARLSGRAPRPRFVVTSSEMLTPGMRRRIAEAFACPVYDTYCSEEFGLIAWECRETGLYHVCDDNVVVEVLKDGRSAREGERGDIVVTALHYYAQPFVRYLLGDEVVPGPAPCPCGAPFSTLSEISGRSVDYLSLPGGRELYAAAAAHVIQAVAPWVEQYELVQERTDMVRVRLVAAPVPPPEGLIRLRDGLITLLGPGIDVELELVPEIVPEPGEKYRFLRSLVDNRL
jgi:phenylacetate-CoA ligase